MTKVPVNTCEFCGKEALMADGNAFHGRYCGECLMLEIEKGVYIGAFKTNQKPVLFNIYKSNANQNVITIGVPGVGKQFNMKEVLDNQEWSDNNE
jgi:hypothetical protein